MRRMVQLAQERKIFLHAHSDADAVERIFKQNPEALVLWAHSGFEQVDKVRAMVTKHKTLWADLAFRSDHAPSGKLDADVAQAVRRLPRPLHGGHRHLHARALALRGRARRLLAQVARRAAGRSRRQHRLPQRRAARRAHHAGGCSDRLAPCLATDCILAIIVPLPLVGRGQGWGSLKQHCTPAFTPPPTPPHQGEGSRVCGSGVALLLAIAILGAGGAAACAVPEGFARLASPEAEIAYRWEPAELKVGQFFAAEVIACRAPGAEPVRTVVLDAQMPAHGHGMNYRPAVPRQARAASASQV